MHPPELKLHPDSVCEVTRYLDIRSITHFSEVNRTAYTTRNACFLELFTRLHPEVVAYAKSQKDSYFCFSELVQYHPSNCWKIACYALSTGIFKADDAFVKEAIPLFRNRFEMSLISCNDGELSSVLKAHQLALKSEFKVVFVRHKMLPLLAESAILITCISTGEMERTPQNLDRIRNLINAGGVVCQDRIWGNLQYSKGWGVQEERWAEKHFDKHLPEMDVLVKAMIEQLTGIKKENLPYWL